MRDTRMKHFTITFKPDNKQISIHAGATLFEAAGQAGIILNTVCGGKGTCKKCLVNLEPDGREVLACQHNIQSDLTVTIPAGSRFFEQKILEHGIDTQIDLAATVHEKYQEKAATGKIFGIAVDIGTTTVVAKLINMADGECHATEATINPQSRYGDDVISRIAYAQDDEKLAELHKAIIDCVNGLTTKLCKKTSINPKHIYEMCVVGNTTMNHIFLKLPVTQLGQAPYKAFSLDAHDIPAAQLHLEMNPAGNIHTVENIAGFVGSDTIAVALAVDIDSTEEMTLVVDIGTNGELVLGTKDKLYAASCAAGPALEGARITCGSRAAEGAIEAVVVNEDDIDLDVIGNASPRSICGSGLIDAVAVMLELGIIDHTGRFVEKEKIEGKVSPAIFSRIREEQSQPAFLLAENDGAGTVYLTQKDIRQMQLAKAAIRAGIRLLQKRIGLEDCDIEHILLAGAFGNYIRKESALRIGLLPTVPVEKIRFVGNAAASGAWMVLVSRHYRETARELAGKIKYIEIAHEPEFQDVYADSMLF
ncbi:MAG TPA: ASKHA domain-containing protein [Sedimentisphaerales bacterium]|nr:ASKHA domain-containing protein [Sedimentisphaerales bacterium]